MARNKYNQVKGTIADALSAAYSGWNDLAEEVREVVDNASGTNRENTQRIQTLDETASTLEEISEPDVSEEIGKLEFIYRDMVMGRKTSRRDRCDNSVSIVESVIQELQTISDDWDEQHKDEDNPYTDLINELEEAKGSAENCEFPGMYG